MCEMCENRKTIWRTFALTFSRCGPCPSREPSSLPWFRNLQQATVIDKIYWNILTRSLQSLQSLYPKRINLPTRVLLLMGSQYMIAVCEISSRCAVKIVFQTSTHHKQFNHDEDALCGTGNKYSILEVSLGFIPGGWIIVPSLNTRNNNIIN
jgi:hypothetical protein